MSRKVIKTIKTITNNLEDYICESQRDLDPTSKEIENCPMIIRGRRTTRDEQWCVQDLIELKDSSNPDKGVKGMGGAFKYLWFNIIDEVKNVLEPGDSFKGDDKNALWDAQGMELEITESLTYFYTKSILNEGEAKT